MITHDVSPDYANEAMVQSELYRRLTDIGYRVIPEYPLKLETGAGIRVDLAVVVAGRVALVIECKNFKREKRTKLNRATRRWSKYESLGLPLIECVRMSAIDQTVEYVRLAMLLTL